MTEQTNLVLRGNAELTSEDPRRSALGIAPADFVAIGFRHGRLVILAFLATLIGALVAAMLAPDTYTSRMKILVRHDRLDPVVTTGSNAIPSFSPEGVTDQEIDSEMELIRSQDLLKQLVEKCNLAESKGHFWTAQLDKWRPAPAAVKVSRAVEKLKQDLTIERVKKSALIEVAYTSRDPELAAKVLKTLGSLYLNKHVAAHRPAGEFEFFKQQAQQYRDGLTDAEHKLAQFSRDPDVVSAAAHRDMALQKITDLQYGLGQTQVAIAATGRRIAALKAQLASTPPRIGSQMKKADNSALLEQLKATLLNLELQRTDLLSKYEPGYVAVKQVETQIAQTRAAIVRETGSPIMEETTDQNSTYQWLSGELAKATADLATLQANADETDRVMRSDRRKLVQFDQNGIVQQDLLRTVKAGEDSYLLYLRKQEEARISDQLDKNRISNVVITDEASVPVLPSSSHWLLALLGIPLGILVSTVAAFIADYRDASFRTPDEVGGFLQMPVLAALPSSGPKKALGV